MANRYVRSTTGDNSNSGASWALAKANMNGGANGDAFGDNIWVSQAHSESTAASIFFDWAGLSNSPVRVLCANDSAEPPTTLATTAVVEATGAASQIQISGSHYCYGITFRTSGTGDCRIWLHNGTLQGQLWENCNFQSMSTGQAGIFINGTGTTSSGDVRWRNCNVKFGNATSFISAQSDRFQWEGGAVSAGGVAPTGLFNISAIRWTEILVSGVDFSQCDQSMYFVSVTGAGRITIRNCKLPLNWNGGLYNGTLGFGARIELYNCDDGDTNYAFMIQDYTGTITQETTIVSQIGASNGLIHYSMKMASSSNCGFDYNQLRSPEISIWNDVIGTPVIFSIDIAHDSLTALTDREVWLEVQYPSDTATPLTTFADDRPGPIAAATAQPASGTTWTTTGLTNPNIQTVSVSFTPQNRGYVHCRVCMGKQSYTLYSDVKIQVS